MLYVLVTNIITFGAPWTENHTWALLDSILYYYTLRGCYKIVVSCTSNEVVITALPSNLTDEVTTPEACLIKDLPTFDIHSDDFIVDWFWCFL